MKPSRAGLYQFKSVVMYLMVRLFAPNHAGTTTVHYRLGTSVTVSVTSWPAHMGNVFPCAVCIYAVLVYVYCPTVDYIIGYIIPGCCNTDWEEMLCYVCIELLQDSCFFIIYRHINEVDQFTLFLAGGKMRFWMRRNSDLYSLVLCQINPRQLKHIEYPGTIIQGLSLSLSILK